ncbi:hypothetical protein IV102_03970 [bacterium]|nr:hypothetical protein [bacterium]
MSAPTFWERVSAFFTPHLGKDEDSTSHGDADDPVKAALDPLDHIRHQALQEVAYQQTDQMREQSLALERADALNHQADMKADILALHQHLETGFDEESLLAFSQDLKEHCKVFRSKDLDQLSQMSVWAVMGRLQQEALDWAWNDFEQRLQSHGLNWPVPSGLAPHADPEEVKQHCRLHREMLRKTFHRGPLLRYADLMLGIVPAWRSLYPERGGTVWRESVYEAVAGALAARRLDVIEKVAEAHHDYLDKQVAEALSAELRPIQERLSGGVASVAEARNLSDQAVAVCQRVAPDIVWNFLKNKL